MVVSKHLNIAEVSEMAKVSEVLAHNPFVKTIV